MPYFSHCPQQSFASSSSRSSWINSLCRKTFHLIVKQAVGKAVSPILRTVTAKVGEFSTLPETTMGGRWKKNSREQSGHSCWPVDVSGDLLLHKNEMCCQAVLGTERWDVAEFSPEIKKGPVFPSIFVSKWLTFNFNKIRRWVHKPSIRVFDIYSPHTLALALYTCAPTVKIFRAYIIRSCFFFSLSLLLRHMPRYLIPYVQKCASKITLWTQSAAHKWEWEAEMKHRDQTVTYQSLFLAQFLCDSTGPQCILPLLMQRSESVFTRLHLEIWLVQDTCIATHF